jgi:DnaJ-class molecular chaperone
LKSVLPDHYATLGLHRRCTTAQIRAAYRALAKQHHPDVNGGARHAQMRTQELNAAYEILSDPARREAYDAEISSAEKSTAPKPSGNLSGNIAKEIYLRLEDFLRGANLTVSVNDPANPHGTETYELRVPPETAPGARFKIPRGEPFTRGCVTVRVKAGPDFRFKTRGSDLRCDLKIKSERAAQGGTEMLRGLAGALLRVAIPRGVGRGEILRVANAGLPKARGGRGDLLVRVLYQPEIRVTRRRG